MPTTLDTTNLQIKINNFVRKAYHPHVAKLVGCFEAAIAREVAYFGTPSFGQAAAVATLGQRLQNHANYFTEQACIHFEILNSQADAIDQLYKDELCALRDVFVSHYKLAADAGSFDWYNVAETMLGADDQDAHPAVAVFGQFIDQLAGGAK